MSFIKTKKMNVLLILTFFIGITFIPTISVSISANAHETYEFVELWDTKTSNPPYNHLKVVDNNTIHIHNDIELATEYVKISGRILIHEGSYSITLSGLQLRKPVKIIGNNSATTIINSPRNAPYAIGVQSQGISIKNLTIRGARSGWDEQSSTQAGIFINPIFYLNYSVINISNNIIKENMNGLFAKATANNTYKDYRIAIYANNISNNDKDGIVLAISPVHIIKNIISFNKESGIDLWGYNNNIVEENEICNNSLDGIWIDQSINNTIFENIINGNLRNGITLFNSDYSNDKVVFCELNKILNNTIFKNNIGIFLYHAKNNDFKYNIIENNIQSGLENINYLNLSSFFKEGWKLGFPTTTENKINNNNFINNGKNGGKNALDSWFNSYNDYSHNYWSNYMEIHKKEDFNGFDRNETWKEWYRIPTNIIGFPLTFLSDNYDYHPYLRANGWGPYFPDIPEKPFAVNGKNNTVVEKPFTISVCCSSDPNQDNVSYKIDWGDGRTITSWEDGLTDEWSNPFYPGLNIKGTHYWVESGTYEVRVQVKDYCMIDKKSDGNSPWSEPLIVLVENS